MSSSGVDRPRLVRRGRNLCHVHICRHTAATTTSFALCVSMTATLSTDNTSILGHAPVKRMHSPEKTHQLWQWWSGRMQKKGKFWKMKVLGGWQVAVFLGCQQSGDLNSPAVYVYKTNKKLQRGESGIDQIFCLLPKPLTRVGWLIRHTKCVGIHLHGDISALLI